MSGILDISAGRFKVIKDGRVSFDTATPAARLAPSQKLLLADYEIEWPDLYKGIFYSTVFDRNDVLGTAQNSASSYAALVGQEWGLGKTYDLADIVLGPAPAGANYLNVRVNLTNTVAPAKIAGDVTLLKALPEGKWSRFSGTSCRVEGHGPLRRSMDILISGGNIVLRRSQSVIDTEGTVQRTNPGSYSTALGNHFYYHPGTPGTNAGYSPGHYASVGQHIDDGPTSGSNNVNPGQSNGASLDTSGVSYRSVWKGTLEITPGRVG